TTVLKVWPLSDEKAGPEFQIPQSHASGSVNWIIPIESCCYQGEASRRSSILPGLSDAKNAAISYLVSVTETELKLWKFCTCSLVSYPVKKRDSEGEWIDTQALMDTLHLTVPLDVGEIPSKSRQIKVTASTLDPHDQMRMALGYSDVRALRFFQSKTKRCFLGIGWYNQIKLFEDSFDLAVKSITVLASIELEFVTAIRNFANQWHFDEQVSRQILDEADPCLFTYYDDNKIALLNVHERKGRLVYRSDFMENISVVAAVKLFIPKGNSCEKPEPEEVWFLMIGSSRGSLEFARVEAYESNQFYSTKLLNINVNTFELDTLTKNKPTKITEIRHVAVTSMDSEKKQLDPNGYIITSGVDSSVRIFSATSGCFVGFLGQKSQVDWSVCFKENNQIELDDEKIEEDNVQMKRIQCCDVSEPPIIFSHETVEREKRRTLSIIISRANFPLHFNSAA
ncbi:hypothetical protein Ciccas_008630, partial [Cichlidogyrus casuarinus]